MKVYYAPKFVAELEQPVILAAQNNRTVAGFSLYISYFSRLDDSGAPIFAGQRIYK